MATIKSLDKGSGLIYSVLKTFENLTTTITNSTTFYRTTIRNFVLEIYSALETIKKELCKKEN